MDVLFVGIDNARWGSARLVYFMKRAGLSVGALCPSGNALAATVHLDRHFLLPPLQSWWGLARTIDRAIGETQPAIVVPADEYVVALFHDLVQRGPNRHIGAYALRVIETSLCPREHFDAMLLKSDTLELASRLGLRVPAGGQFTTASEAAAIAAQLEYPLYVKQSFGWAGGGVVKCENNRDLERATARHADPIGHTKSWARKLLGRDWYPRSASRAIQSAVIGMPGMYSAFAWRGKTLGGYGGLTITGTSTTGPSSALRLCSHAEMEHVAETMIAAFGATGFIGFDFMIEESTGHAYLLECNARPVQGAHLGALVGVDLAEFAALAVNAKAPSGPAAVAGRTLDVALFPYSLKMDTAAMYRDVPQDDPGLMRHYAETQGRAATPGESVARIPASRLQPA